MKDEKVTYFGIWLPGKGWLRSKEDDKESIYADLSFDKSKQVARLIGRGAKVLYIDQSIVDFERHYLEQERRSIWHIFKSYFAHKKHS